MFLILAMLTPGTELPEVDLFDSQDKAVHLICFTIQAYLWAGVGVKDVKNNRFQPRVWINFLVFGILAGILLEFIQRYIPNRSFDWLDMLVNVIGGILGLFVYFKWPTIKYILD